MKNALINFAATCAIVASSLYMMHHVRDARADVATCATDSECEAMPVDINTYADDTIAISIVVRAEDDCAYVVRVNDMTFRLDEYESNTCYYTT